MDPVPVVTCFLRHDGDVLLGRRSDAVASYPGLWGAIAGHVAPDDAETAETDAAPGERTPDAAARAEIREETGIDDATLVRTGEPFQVDDEATNSHWLVHPFLFDVPTRSVEPNPEFDEIEWTAPAAILDRDTVPRLWTSYDRVRPRVATLAEDREHGSAWLSLRALEVLRDEAALAVAGKRDDRETAERDDCVTAERDDRETAERDDCVTAERDDREIAESGDGDWEAMATLARRLLAARPSMAVITNRINRVMHAAGRDGRTSSAILDAASAGIERAVEADREAATVAARELPGRVATLSRSGTVLVTLEERAPDAVLIAESRPGREGVGVAETLADSADGTVPPDVTLTTDAAFAHELVDWNAEALLVGADRILPDGRVLNKVGTRGAALAAPSDCPVYVVAASDKIAIDDVVDVEERDPGEVYDGDAPLSVSNPTFDVTPADAVTAVVTDRGRLDAAEIDAIVAEHRDLTDW